VAKSLKDEGTVKVTETKNRDDNDYVGKLDECLVSD
jgi:hypothetical protein